MITNKASRAHQNIKEVIKYHEVKTKENGRASGYHEELCGFATEAHLALGMMAAKVLEAEQDRLLGLQILEAIKMLNVEGTALTELPEHVQAFLLAVNTAVLNYRKNTNDS